MRRPVGVKWVLLFFRWTKIYLSGRVCRCRHASIRTLEERFVSLGASWAFSFQPVLPSDYRPVVLLFESGTRARRLTQSPELGFGFCLFSSWNDFDFVLPFSFTRLPLRSFGCCCATVRRLLHSPTGDAATPPAFSRWQRSPVSSRFFHRARPASGPSAADHSQGRTDPEYAAHLAPIAFADRDRLPC